MGVVKDFTELKHFKSGFSDSGSYHFYALSQDQTVQTFAISTDDFSVNIIVCCSFQLGFRKSDLYHCNCWCYALVSDAKEIFQNWI
jgi:hypothetical protein